MLSGVKDSLLRFCSRKVFSSLMPANLLTLWQTGPRRFSNESISLLSSVISNDSAIVCSRVELPRDMSFSRFCIFECIRDSRSTGSVPKIFFVCERIVESLSLTKVVESWAVR